ncbi:pilus assembly protein PilP [Cocleimonas sp. KMM 6892]|uniref:pilus assembly protein PilP n=1 Tax=unclassified Cocleimonas TaxID=2639732 RepID=UPI002DBA84DC|nr:MULTISPECIES: pilus assembly protein PilP [unclassified Cocleimonas]MEB8432462.1 pilus assembly protein PilP [Cocleimonas sp. KMM 6892]MEC4715321.1 pilus assembly protein PilP [Cocleimonas sp. KMM 6895]MEC4745060.1 pilus assembly protein PilP [Cocleimonas sp. KMM 6896]
MLTGCNVSKADLDTYFAEQRSKPAAPIVPIPEVKPYLRYIYPEHEKDPFDAAMLAPNTVREEIIDNGINIDTTRVPEFLEGFPLDSLRMVGTVKKDNTLWALVKIPEGAVQTVKAGNYLGQNYGKIMNISEVKMDMVETVSNGLGGYKERDISIALNQE